MKFTESVAGAPAGVGQRELLAVDEVAVAPAGSVHSEYTVTVRPMHLAAAGDAALGRPPQPSEHEGGEQSDGCDPLQQRVAP